MSQSQLSRLKFGGAVVGAFLCGLVFASGFDLTRFGYAQQTHPETRLVSNSATPVNPPAVAELNSAFTSIAEQVTPAVVSVSAERTHQAIVQGNRGRGAPPNSLEDFFGQFDPQQQQQPQAASGTGFIVSADGYILTNNHVVANFDRLTVKLLDNRSFPARLIGRDPTTDVAVLKIDAKNLPTVGLGDDENVKIGEWVLAIGNPLGLDFTVTAGIVSAKGRGGGDLAALNRDPYAVTDYIQTDAAINPGNSGGPLVNIRGEVIGINAAIATTTGFYSGYGFAIPISLAKNVMNDIITHGRVRRAMLGVSIQPVDAADAAVAGLKDISGVKVGDYNGDDSPAKKAGLEPGDIIVKADGKVADHVSTLQRIIRSHEPGDVVDVEAMRYGQRKDFKVKLGEVPDSTARVAANPTSAEPAPAGVVSDKLGISVEAITDDAAKANNIPVNRRGLRVTQVNPDGPGRTKFVPSTDVLVQVLSPTPRRELKAPADLQQVLSKLKVGDYISLFVYNVQNDQTRVVNMKIGDSQ